MARNHLRGSFPSPVLTQGDSVCSGLDILSVLLGIVPKT